MKGRETINRPTCTAVILALALSPATVMAGNGKGKGKGRDKSESKVERVNPEFGVKPGQYAKHCPPGLAKKAVPCVPPGQVKNRYRVGDYIKGDYDWMDDPNRYGLRRGGSYIRAGDYVYQIDKETHEVLNLIGAVADILD